MRNNPYGVGSAEATAYEIGYGHGALDAQYGMSAEDYPAEPLPSESPNRYDTNDLLEQLADEFGTDIDLAVFDAYEYGHEDGWHAQRSAALPSDDSHPQLGAMMEHHPDIGCNEQDWQDNHSPYWVTCSCGWGYLARYQTMDDVHKAYEAHYEQRTGRKIMWI